MAVIILYYYSWLANIIYIFSLVGKPYIKLLYYYYHHYKIDIRNINDGIQVIIRKKPLYLIIIYIS